jgi:hypothetical protein
MVKVDIDYGMVMDVTRTWDRLKESTGPEFKDVVGEVVFLK